MDSKKIGSRGRVRVRRCVILTLLSAMVTSAVCSAETPAAAPSSANQLWYDGQFTFPLHHHIDIVGSGTLRLGRGMGHLVYERLGSAVNFKVARFLMISPSFNYVASQPWPGRHAREQRYALDATFLRRFHGFDLSDRNRFERRVTPAVTYFRYMNRFQVQHPLGLASRRFLGTVSDEVFYDGHLETWSRNRFYAGIGKWISPFILMEFYYLRQNDHYSRPGDINAFGVSFKSQSFRRNG